MFDCTTCISLVIYSLCVFFFKQKTAYEMRISDWSSDVCSSDLPLRQQYYDAHPDQHPGEGKENIIWISYDELCAVARGLKITICVYTELEIGRASCRERVCQYV